LSQQPRLASIIRRESKSLFLIADIRLLITLSVALAEGFEEDYAGGYADVEGLYGADGWQRDEEVKALAAELNVLHGRAKLPEIDVFSLMKPDA